MRLDTRWLTVEASVCRWRDGWWPTVTRYADGGDAYIPVPFVGELWVRAFSPLVPYRESNFDQFPPDPPHECADDECDYVARTYGALLVHNERVHHADGDDP